MKNTHTRIKENKVRNPFLKIEIHLFSLQAKYAQRKNVCVSLCVRFFRLVLCKNKQNEYTSISYHTIYALQNGFILVYLCLNKLFVVVLVRNKKWVNSIRMVKSTVKTLAHEMILRNGSQCLCVFCVCNKPLHGYSVLEKVVRCRRCWMGHLLFLRYTFHNNFTPSTQHSLYVFMFRVLQMIIFLLDVSLTNLKRVSWWCHEKNQNHFSKRGEKRRKAHKKKHCHRKTLSHCTYKHGL